MSKNTMKSKYLFSALGLITVAGVVASAISVPFVLKKQNSDSTYKKETLLVETRTINTNENQISVRVSGLKNYIGQWLNVEYDAEKPIVKTASSPTSEQSNSTQGSQKRSFFVSNDVANVIIGGLVPNVQYNYKITTKNGDLISKLEKFSTYSVPELIITSTETSIKLSSSEINKDHLGDNLVIRYKLYPNSSSSIEQYQSSSEVAVSLQQKEIEGKQVYVIDNEIEGLEKSKPYIVSLHIVGQEGALSNPIIIWTKGNVASLAIAKETPRGAEIQIGGLEDYLADSSSEVISFRLKYFAKTAAPVASPVTIVESEVFYRDIKLGEDSVVLNNLEGLKPNTEYTVQLIKLDNNQEETLGQQDFWTLAQPMVIAKSSADTTSTKWQKSLVNAKLYISGLKSKQDASKDINHSDLEARIVVVEDESTEYKFNAESKKAEIQAPVATTSDEYAIDFSELESGKRYALQIFKKTDTEFKNPLLEEAFIETQMPTLLESEIAEVATTTAKIKIKKLNNYKSNEIKLVTKNKTTNAQSSFNITFEEEAIEAEVDISSLSKNTAYEYWIYPVYEGFDSDIKNNLLSEVKEFQTLGILTAATVAGNNFTDSLTFNLTGMDRRFPVDESMVLQWRIKPTDTAVAWEDITTDTDNINEFTVSAIPEDGNFSIVVSNNNRSKTWLTNQTYQWRVVQKSKPTINLILGGTAEFTLADDMLSLSYRDKIVPTSSSSINWRNPLFENIVGSGLGNASDKKIWRPFFALSTQNEWQNFLEWLAFQDTNTIDKFARAFKISFSAFGPLNAARNWSKDNLFTTRWIAMPFLPSNHGGPSENKTYDALEVPEYGVFGGYGPTQNTSDTPIKPSDFSNESWKFKNVDSVVLAMKYYLNGIKNGWGRTSNFGVSRNNVYADGNALSKEQTYASYLTEKAKLDANINISVVSGKSLEGWSLESVDNTASEINIWANDFTGDLHFKVKASKGDKVHYYWTKMSGFKTATNEIAINKTDLNFALQKDHVKTVEIINKKLSVATDSAAKKAIIQKYYNVTFPALYKTGWTFVSATLNEAKDKLILKAKLPKLEISNGTILNPSQTTPKESEEEFTYELSGRTLNMPDITYATISSQKGLLESADNGLSSNARWVQTSWTYEQMISKMQEAVIKGDAAINAFADKLFNAFNVLVDWNNASWRFYFRTMGEAPLLNWADHVVSSEDKKINDENKNGFVTEVLGMRAAGVQLADHQKTRLKEMIKKYGTISAPSSSS